MFQCVVVVQEFYEGADDPIVSPLFESFEQAIEWRKRIVTQEENRRGDQPEWGYSSNFYLHKEGCVQEICPCKETPLSWEEVNS